MKVLASQKKYQATYRKRKLEDGLCIYGGCNEKLYSQNHCSFHFEYYKAIRRHRTELKKQERISQGKCVIRSCSNDALPDSIKCQDHTPKYFSSKERQQRHREKRRRQGLCIGPGCNRKSTKGADHCEPCLIGMRERAKARRAKYKQLGMCIRDGCYENAKPGNTMCEHHLEELRCR